MPVRCFLYAAHALEKYLNDTKKARFQALGSYESYLEDNLPDLHFYADITARFEEINGLYRKYDDYCISFDDLLVELNTANPKEIIKLELIHISILLFCSIGIISTSQIHPQLAFYSTEIISTGHFHLYLALLFHRDYFDRSFSSLSCSFVPQRLFRPVIFISILLFCSTEIISTGQMHPCLALLCRRDYFGRPDASHHWKAIAETISAWPFRQILICSAKIVYHSAESSFSSVRK